MYRYLHHKNTPKFQTRIKKKVVGFFDLYQVLRVGTFVQFTPKEVLGFSSEKHHLKTRLIFLFFCLLHHNFPVDIFVHKTENFGSTDLTPTSKKL